MPKPFRLQSVLDYRHSLVEALEIELGRLHNEREQRLALLENARARKTGLLTELGQAQTGAIDMTLIHQLRAALERQETSIAQQLQLLHKLQAAIEQKNRETIAAKQDEEALQT
ncbi:MAG TPA: hypothetical protein VLS48_02045, partial [Anaerolineales bacterium]|nr:hypothetical protein [Anaerolineales bacterium]